MKKATLYAAAVICATGMVSPSLVQAAEPAGVAVSAPAAQITVRGTVVDKNGEPVPGASVVQKGTTNGVNTDIDGKFTLRVDGGSTLVISFVGYTTQSLKATPSLKVVLQEDTELLDDVVVVGYGTMKRTDLTGASSNIKPQALTSSIGQSALQSLQGKSSGVAVFNNNKPGASPKIRVRGSGSISASNNPLLVVDGVPLNDADLNDINPADIESMEVLKDASSTAIYGSRGANGVIMITTKKGSEGHKNLNIHAGVGVQMRSRLVDFISNEDFVKMTGYTNNNPNGGYTDWQREIIQSTALTQDYSATLDGKAGDTNYMFSAGYYNQEGLVRGQGYERFSVHNNLIHKFNSWLTIGSSMQLTNANQDVFDNATGELARCGFPTEPVYKADGSWNIVSGAASFNPIAEAAAVTNRTNSLRFLGNFYAEAQILKQLSYKVSIGYDTRWTRNYNYSSSQIPNRLVANQTNSSGGHKWGKYRDKLIDNILTYKDQWGKHRLTATAVYSWQDHKTENLSVSSNAFDNDLLQAWSIGGVELNSWSSGISSNRLISFTGRVSYAYDDKYLLTATSRWDGSSRFGENKKWGVFPSVGLGWRVSEEDFLSDNEVVTDLKLRASYGVTGNQEIGNYQSLSRLSTSTSTAYSNGTSALPGYNESLGNKDLKWERTTQYDAGLDLQLWGRLNINVDWYDRNTDDLLYNVPIPSNSGFSNILSNIGKVNNHGLEVTMGGVLFKNRDWTIDASVNFTYNENEIKELYGDTKRVEVNHSKQCGLAQILEVGMPVNSVWGRKALGIIKTQEDLDWYTEYAPTAAKGAQLGDEMYEDVNGDGSVSIDDYVCLGSVEPKYYYGFNLNVQWKKLSISVYGQGAFKYASILGSENSSMGGATTNLGFSDTGSYLFFADNSVLGNNYIPSAQAYKEMWSTENTDGNRPRRGSTSYLSTRTNADWSYFILKNVQLSYDFSSLIKIKGIKGFSFDVNFQNFATAATTYGYNPENGDMSNPWGKTIMFGLNAKF